MKNRTLIIFVIIIILLACSISAVPAYKYFRRMKYLNHIKSEYVAERRLGYSKLRGVWEDNPFYDEELVWAVTNGLYDDDEVVRRNAYACLRNVKEVNWGLNIRLADELYNDIPGGYRFRLLSTLYFDREHFPRPDYRPLAWLLKNVEMNREETLIVLKCFTRIGSNSYGAGEFIPLIERLTADEDEAIASKASEVLGILMADPAVKEQLDAIENLQPVE